MIEDTRRARRKAVERQNGLWSTWWYYNRLTLACFLIFALGTLGMVLQEKRATAAAQDEARHMRRVAQALSCYSWEAPTSLIIAGGSREAVDEALLRAAVAATDRYTGRLASK